MAKKEPHVSASRPPVVAVLGHVDHGKTTLLDTIRKAHVADGEHGGITQKIGAYQIHLETRSSKLEPRSITFIDTPGHEAFAKMRSRGASTADIVVLVVAADDSVKPQTIESIKQIKEAGVPMIVAMNKMDLEGARPDKVKADLAKNGVQVEGFGGSVPMVPVSGKTGKGVPELLEMILLVSDMGETKVDATGPVVARVIETKVDKGRGMVASVVVKSGTLRPGMSLYAEDKQVAKVRALFDEHSVSLREVGPGKPAEVLGFTQLPEVGAALSDTPKAAKVVAKVQAAPLGLPDFLKPINPEDSQKLKIVLKTDTAGSMEAVVASLPKQIQVVSQAVGEISEADIILAKNSGSIVVGFGVDARGNVAKLATTESVIFRSYKIIYELIDELREVAEGMREVLGGERELGEATIIAEFPFDGQRILGVKITSGRIAKGDMVKIMRSNVEKGKAKVKSVRQGKNEVTKVTEGHECGVLLDKPLDFMLGDGIIAYITG